MPGRAQGTQLQGRDHLSCGAQCAGGLCMDVFVRLRNCSRMSAFVHAPQRFL